MYIFKFLYRLILNIRCTERLKHIYKTEQLIKKISYLVGAQFRLDNIGRIYAVVNPAVRDGVYNQEQVLEWTDSGLKNDEYVKKWIIDYFILLENFVNSNNLFELLTFNLTKIDDSGNYLCVLQPISLTPVFQSIKPALIELCFILGICGGILVII